MRGREVRKGAVINGRTEDKLESTHGRREKKDEQVSLVPFFLEGSKHSKHTSLCGRS